MCAIVHRCRHCVHLTPYRAPRNSAWMRLELPAQGVAREDPRPRPGAGAGAGVHRPPSTLFKRHPLAHQWGSNYPCDGHSGGTRPSPRGTVPWLSGPGQAQQKHHGPPLSLGARCREPRMCSAKATPAPAPHGRHGMAAAARQTRKALAGPPLTGPAQRWQAVSDSTAPCQCLAVWC